MARVRVVAGEFAPATGWDPVTIMARLLAECLDAGLSTVPTARVGSDLYPALSRLPRRRGPLTTIVVAPQPVHLYALLDRGHWSPGNGVTAGWVIDSFLTDRVPAVARLRGHFDQLFVTDAELVDEWRSITGVPTTWLPWGTDALGRGSASPDRPVDLVRIGRQPPEWDDDEATALRLAAHGLTFRGRPPRIADPDGNLRSVMGAAAEAKFTLSFTNRLSPAAYTHPTREYLTARWVDALASGASVAGVVPRCASAERLLWPEATLDLGGTDPVEGTTVVADAVRGWTPALAAHNHALALSRLDWRWRFAELAEVLHLDAGRLDEQLGRLRAEIAARSAGG